MKVLIVGGGGREHALAWKIAQSPLVTKLYCAPGNPGIAQCAECVPIGVQDSVSMVRFAKEKGIDLTVIGPEDPLSMGLADELTSKGFKVFGPSQKAAELESSKVFCKKLLHKHDIPTAAFKVFDDTHGAHDYLDKVGAPIVVKADGLAKGKGVMVCSSLEEAHRAVDEIMEARVFGKAGDRIIIEECLRGEEASLLALTDGKALLLLDPAQDHKRALDGDQGPNTGGMGAYSPVTAITAAMRIEVERRIFIPTIHAMRREGRRYQGVLYAGLMLTSNGPQVLEYNVRWGDPETQPLMMRIKSDILPLFLSIAEGKMGDAAIEWDPRPAICVVMASGGYPGEYQTGRPIEGLEKAARLKDVQIFHAGTAASQGRVVTAGGRVLGVTALGKTVADARARAYEAVSMIHFDGAHYRRDIGHLAL